MCTAWDGAMQMYYDEAYEKAYEEAYEEAYEKAYKTAYETASQKISELAAEQFADSYGSLISRLLSEGRSSDLLRAAGDIQYCKDLFESMNIPSPTKPIRIYPDTTNHR